MMVRILVIDDDAAVRELICQILEGEGYAVQQAADGNEGLRLFRQNPHDLIITDMIMPGKDGVEVMMEMKELLPDVRILAISGGGRGMDANFNLEFAIDFGALRTLAKPFSRREMVDSVKALLQ